MVADTETAVLCANMVGWYTQVFFDCMTAAAPIWTLTSRINLLLLEKESAKLAVDQAKGKLDEKTSGRNMYSADVFFLQNELKSCIDKLRAIESAINEEVVRREEYSRVAGLLVLEKFDSADVVSVPVLLALRRDLGIDTDEAALRRALKKQKGFAQAKVAEIVK